MLTGPEKSNKVTIELDSSRLTSAGEPPGAAGNATSPASRYMDKAGTHLSYNVYTSAGYSKVWGDGSGGSLTQSYNGLLSLGTISFTGYGRLPSGQYVASGAYSDRLVVTVSY